MQTLNPVIWMLGVSDAMVEISFGQAAAGHPLGGPVQASSKIAGRTITFRGAGPSSMYSGHPQYLQYDTNGKHLVTNGLVLRFDGKKYVQSKHCCPQKLGTARETLCLRKSLELWAGSLISFQDRGPSCS